MQFSAFEGKSGFLLKIEKEMVEYWTKDTKVFKEVQNMPARTKIIAAYPSLSPAERQAADFILSDPDASLLAVEICSETSAAAKMISALDTL